MCISRKNILDMLFVILMLMHGLTIKLRKLIPDVSQSHFINLLVNR